MNIEIVEDGLCITRDTISAGQDAGQHAVAMLRGMHEDDVCEGTMDVMVDGHKVGEISLTLVVEYFSRSGGSDACSRTRAL